MASCLFFVASTVSALPTNVDKSGRAFSLFSVVTFPNTACVTAMGAMGQGAGGEPMLGLCVTSEQCTEDGGEASGNCASGFGVCCMVTVSETDTRLRRNITYIQNDGFPMGIGEDEDTAGEMFAWEVEGSSDICQIRLDFIDTVLTPPLAATDGGVNAGTCNEDSLAIVQPASAIIGFNNLCGTLTGQHMYIGTGRANPAATIQINLDDRDDFERTWKIQVTTLECNNPSLAPNGCLQYYFGASGGRITSFNSQAAAPQMILNQLYSVCIRQEAGFDCIEYRQTEAMDSFQLGAGTTVNVGQPSCMESYLIIPTPVIPAVSPDAGVKAAMAQSNTRYCGNALGPIEGFAAGTVRSNSLPFQIIAVTDNNALGNASPAPSLFDISYQQVPC